MARLWDCLSPDAQNCIRLFQLEHQPSWTPPHDDSPAIRVHCRMPGATVKKNLTVETRGRENVPAIMQATPADVKHNRGVFA